MSTLKGIFEPFKDYVQVQLNLRKESIQGKENIQEKDLNDLAYKISTRKIQRVVDDNTAEGLEAELKLKEWKKV